MEGTPGELDAVPAYFDKLKPQCETKVSTYEERKAAREQEIEGRISGPPLRTGGHAALDLGHCKGSLRSFQGYATPAQRHAKHNRQQWLDLFIRNRRTRCDQTRRMSLRHM